MQNSTKNRQTSTRVTRRRKPAYPIPTPDEHRKKRGTAYADLDLIKQTAEGFEVCPPSLNQNFIVYSVRDDQCTCLAFRDDQACEHVEAVKIYIERAATATR